MDLRKRRYPSTICLLTTYLLNRSQAKMNVNDSCLLYDMRVIMTGKNRKGRFIKKSSVATRIKE